MVKKVMRISISIVRTLRAHFPHQCQKMIVGREDGDVDGDVDDDDDDDDDDGGDDDEVEEC